MNSQRPETCRPLRRILGTVAASMLMLASFPIPAAHAAIGDLHPYAGGIGDGGQSAGSALVSPAGVAVSAGNVYLADAKDHRVRKIDTAGVISTFAGTGVGGNTGDGAAATAAKIDTPRDVVADASGNLYIADEASHVVRKVTPGGTISTVAGKGTAGFSGDDGAATAAELNGPTGLAVNSAGDLFIADFGNKRVRKVTASTGVITTIAGNGTADWQGDALPATTLPVDARDVAVDPEGNVYIADYANNRVRLVAADTNMYTIAGSVCPDSISPGAITQNGDEGPAGTAFLCRPSSLAFDAAGNLYIADSSSQRVRKILATWPAGESPEEPTGPIPLTSTHIITTVAGNGTAATDAGGVYACPATSSSGGGKEVSLCFPSGIAVDPTGALYVADTGNALLRKLAVDGSLSTIAGQRFGGDGGPAENAVLRDPRGVAVDGTGNVYVSDTANNRVRKVTPAGVISTVAGTGTAGFAGDAAMAVDAQLNGPTGLAVTPQGVLYIADTQNDRVRRVDAAGIISTVAGTGSAGFAGDNGPAAAAQVNKPLGLGLDANGSLYIADTQNDRIRKVDATGLITSIAGNGTAGFAGDAADATLAQINKPSGVAVFESTVYISDTENHRIRKVQGGIISSIAGTGTAGCTPGSTPDASALNRPAGIATDIIGQLFVTNSECGMLQRIDTAGKIETLAGTGALGYSGDSGKATETILGRLTAVATDRSGNIYVADSTNDRVRLIEDRPPDSTPPLASFTVSPSIIANSVVGFSEDVKNVTSSNIVLRASGSGSNTPSAQTCRDAAGGVVACSSGKVRRVDLDPTVTLIPGQTYSVIVNPADAAIKVGDIAGNITASTTRTFRTSLQEQENSLASRFAWRTLGETGAIGRSYTVENTPGASAIVTFTGRSVTWYTKAGPDQGLANVYIDGVFKGSFNQFATSPKFGVARIFDGLSDTAHRFQLVVRGVKGSSYASDVRVVLDGVRAAGVLSQTPSAAYSWQSLPNSKVSGGRYQRSRFPGSSVSFTFRGTGIDWYTIAGPSMGLAAVYVDGVLKATIDNYASSDVLNVRRSLRGLSNATHTLKIVVTGKRNSRSSSTFVVIDRYIVL